MKCRRAFFRARPCGLRSPRAELEIESIPVLAATGLDLFTDAELRSAAYADLLIVDGDPIKDIMLMLDYENNFKLIMKDGKVYKNTL